MADTLSYSPCAYFRGGRLALVTLLSLAGISGCTPPRLATPPAPSEREPDLGPPGRFPDSGIGSSDLLLTRASPDHGTFLGG
ncbi:MAG: hypothetical protein AAF645_28575, partial [Myxococcota bacterium]